MKKLLQLLGFATLAGFLATTVTACGDDETEPTVTVTIKADPETLPSFTASGETKTVTVTVDPSTVKWTAEKNQDWITVTPEGDRLTIEVSENEGAARSGIVTLKASGADNLPISINQVAAGEVVFNVTPTSLIFKPEGEEKNVQVECEAEWKATSAATWLKISDKEGSFSVKADPYDGTDKPREAEITVTAASINKSATVKVTQNQVGVIGELDVDRRTLDFENEGGTETVKVTSNVEWWAVDKGLNEWLKIEKGDGEFTVTADPYEEFNGAREAEITVEADGVDEPIIVKVSQKQPQGYLRASVERIDTEYSTRLVSLTVYSNTTWTIGWGSENYYDPGGQPNAGWWAAINKTGGTGDMDIQIEFSTFYPQIYPEARRAELVIKSDNVDEDVIIPFVQGPAPVVELTLGSIDELFGEWDVTGEIIRLADGQIFENNHVITISRSDLKEDAILVSNLTNINAYNDIIGKEDVKGDEGTFWVDVENAKLTLTTNDEKQASIIKLEPDWNLDDRSGSTLLCAMLQEDIANTIVYSMRFPLVQIILKEDGRHEIEMFSDSYSIQHGGKGYYGSFHVCGQNAPRYYVYASLFGTKWTKRP